MGDLRGQVENMARPHLLAFVLDLALDVVSTSHSTRRHVRTLSSISTEVQHRTIPWRGNDARVVSALWAMVVGTQVGDGCVRCGGKLNGGGHELTRLPKADMHALTTHNGNRATHIKFRLHTYSPGDFVLFS